MTGSREHWQRLYGDKPEQAVSWYEARPEVSLSLIDSAGLTRDSAVIDIGAGAARLVDFLVERGLTDVTVLDLSAAALGHARERLAGHSGIEWIVCDVLAWRPGRRYDLWHDRAVFHFLTDPADRRRYVEVLSAALKPGGHAVIGTFALDGPERCSGLPVMRYDAAGLLAELGAGFELVRSVLHDHHTPSGALQRFHFGLFRKL